MKPYFQDDKRGLTIYHGDALNVLPQLDCTADLLIADPPYGQKYESRAKGLLFPTIEGDYSQEIGLMGIKLALERLRHNRHVYVFGRFELSELPLGGLIELIWDKELANNSCAEEVLWSSSHEYIQFGVYSPRPSVRNAGHGNGLARLRRNSVLRHQRLSGGEVRKHPTEKPIDLLREFIESSSRIGELVLDPFMGSGSTLEAAHREGRKCIGIEIEESYCETSAKRFEQMPLMF